MRKDKKVFHRHWYVKK